MKNNRACIAQIKGEYIKGDRMKHILLNYFTPMSNETYLVKLFYTHDLEEHDDISVQQIYWKNNFEKFIHKDITHHNIRDVGV